MKLRPLSLCALRLSILAAAAAAGPALAAISNGVTTVDGFANDPEFFLVLHDATAEASYVLDLGLKGSTLFDVGRSDAGYQRFWTLDRALDPRLAKLLDLGSSTASLSWGVFAADFEGFSGEAGQYYLFTTVRHDTPTGVVNPNYTSLLSRINDNFLAAVSTVSGFAIELNIGNTNPDNQIGITGSEDYAHNGSSFAAKGQLGYGDSTFFPIASSITAEFNIPAMSPVGRSSWAYYVTEGGVFDIFANVLVDEFDNTEHDAFWGLAQDPGTGILYLSFTLEAAGMTPAQRAFTAGIGRTEFGGSFAVRALPGIAVASGLERPTGYARAIGSAVTLPAVALPPVPEPATWGLMALGLLATGAAARRRRG